MGFYCDTLKIYDEWYHKKVAFITDFSNECLKYGLSIKPINAVLLGFMRNRRIIQHHMGADFFIWNTEFKRLKPILRDFDVIISDKGSDPIHIKNCIPNFSIDISIFSKDLDYVVPTNFVKFNKSHRPSLFYRYFKLFRFYYAKRLCYPISWFDNYFYMKAHDFKWPIFTGVYEYLLYMYGDNWPIRDTNKYYVHDRYVIPQRIWLRNKRLKDLVVKY